MSGVPGFATTRLFLVTTSGLYFELGREVKTWTLGPSRCFVHATLLAATSNSPILSIRKFWEAQSKGKFQGRFLSMGPNNNAAIRNQSAATQDARLLRLGTESGKLPANACAKRGGTALPT